MILAKLLSKIYKKNGIILIDSGEQQYICGKPDLKNLIKNHFQLKFLHAYKLLENLNPDL